MPSPVPAPLAAGGAGRWAVALSFLVRMIAAIASWLARTCAANSPLRVPVARVSSSAISRVSSAQPAGCQASSRNSSASPVSRGLGPADAALIKGSRVARLEDVVRAYEDASAGAGG